MAEYRDRRKEEERVKAVRNDRGALMNERSRRVQIERKKKLRKKKQRRRVLVSALVEVLILTVLAIAFCWNRGLEAKVSGLTGWFDGPPVTGNIINLRLDITHLYYPAKNSFQKGRLKRREIFTELLLYTLTT